MNIYRQIYFTVSLTNGHILDRIVFCFRSLGIILLSRISAFSGPKLELNAAYIVFCYQKTVENGLNILELGLGLTCEGVGGSPVPHPLPEPGLEPLLSGVEVVMDNLYRTVYVNIYLFIYTSYTIIHIYKYMNQHPRLLGVDWYIS